MQPHTKEIYKILKDDTTLRTLLGASPTAPHISQAIADLPEVFPCVTYEIADSRFMAVPSYGQTIVLQIMIFSKENKQQLEDIFSRVNYLLNYYQNKLLGNQSRVVWMRLDSEVDQNPTDRQLFMKVVRYQIVGKFVN